MTITQPSTNAAMTAERTPSPLGWWRGDVAFGRELVTTGEYIEVVGRTSEAAVASARPRVASRRIVDVECPTAGMMARVPSRGERGSVTGKKKRKRPGSTNSRPASRGDRPGRLPWAPAPSKGKERPDVIWLLALATVAALLAAVGLAYDARLFAPYYLSRFLPLLPLALCLVLLALGRVRPGARPVRFDTLDLTALAFAGWQVVSALLSPTFVVAFLGYYNRGAGSVFWVALALVFIASRRLLEGERSLRALVWIVSAVVIAAAVVALAQALGATALWGGVASRDRLTGTTGNPISLGGLGLLAVWLGAGLPQWRRFGATWMAGAAGTAAGLLAVVFSVSRAATAALAVCAVVLAVMWLRRRRRATIVALAAAVAIVVIAGAAYSAGPGSSVLTRFQGSPKGGLNGSDDKRVELWGEALQGAASRPLAGVGSGAFVVVDRLYRPVERRIRNPWALASDPHSLPLAVASTSGLVGVLVGGFLCWLLVVRIWRRWRPPAHMDGEGPHQRLEAKPRNEPEPELGASGTSAGIALLYLLVAAVFSLVSPVESVVLVPAALIAGAAAGAPREGERWSWRLAAMRDRGTGRAVLGALLAVCGVALVVSLAAGVQWYRADLAFAAFARGASASEGERAAGLWRWEPFYALQTGAHVWRDGLANEDDAALARGRDLVERAVALDATGPLGYADLARLELSQGSASGSVDQLRSGLRWNPSHPVLQGLWGYTALTAQSILSDPAEARRLLAGLQALPVDTPDGWFWVSKTLKVRGDTSGAIDARARAKELSPRLGSWRYGQRLLQSR